MQIKNLYNKAALRRRMTVSPIFDNEGEGTSFTNLNQNEHLLPTNALIA